MSLVGGAAGPLGGDDLRLSIEVDAGAALVLRGVAATLVLPGPRALPSRMETTIRVAAGGVLVWLPSPTIAAHGCCHHLITRVWLEPGARLLLREELLLGRHGEQPGTLRQRLRVCLADRPLYDQELAIGSGATGWAGPAVTGGHRAVGSALLVDPDWHGERIRQMSRVTADTAVLPLSGPAIAVTALANDAPSLRLRLDGALSGIGAASPHSRSAQSHAVATTEPAAV
jgi:urease accessory protein